VLPEMPGNGITNLTVYPFKNLAIYFAQAAQLSFIQQPAFTVEVLGLWKISEYIIFGVGEQRF
jgi:hypothetical protein